MKLSIRSRLALQFTLIVGFILILFSVSVYYFSADYRETEFFERLENRALTKAKLLIKIDEFNYDLLKVIDRNTEPPIMNNARVLIFNSKNQLIYNSLDDTIQSVSNSLLHEIRLKKKLLYHDGKYDVVGVLYPDKKDDFVVISSALDTFGLDKLENLKIILSLGILVSIAFTLLIGRIYAERALRPMLDVIKQVDKITISSMNMRVSEGNKTDEIAHLAITFNKMLDRLAGAFEMQKNFVANASHELRTPLTSITGQIEVSLMRPRDIEEYKSILHSVLEDIRNLNELSNGLLDMAKANSDISEIAMQNLRVDELILETQKVLISRNNDYKISIQFETLLDDDKKVTVLGNEYLIKTALINVMDNGCKYSGNKSIEVLISNESNHLVLDITDSGIGIDQEDIGKIFQPFFRAKNVINIAGKGIGLALSEKIIKIHSGDISVVSKVGKGSTITIRLPIVI